MSDLLLELCLNQKYWTVFQKELTFMVPEIQQSRTFFHYTVVGPCGMYSCITFFKWVACSFFSNLRLSWYFWNCGISMIQITVTGALIVIFFFKLSACIQKSFVRSCVALEYFFQLYPPTWYSWLWGDEGKNDMVVNNEYSYCFSEGFEEDGSL